MAGTGERLPPEPYRLLFPFGFLFGIWGTAPWISHALGWSSYPGVLHRTLMVQGFEMSFVLGFLLTALPGFTHGGKCHPVELLATTLTMTLFTLSMAAGWIVLAPVAFAIGTIILLQAVIRRWRRASAPPAAELSFVVFGLALGAVAGVLQFLREVGMMEPPPRFPERLATMGMLLPIVLGVGGLLVPVFAGMRQPLAMSGVAGAHERRGRVVLIAAVITLLIAALALELVDRRWHAAALRAVAAMPMLLLSWKIGHLPGFRTVPAFALWISGWCLVLGLWAPVLLPALEIAGLHVAFIGGLGTLTIAIATRVIMAHGRHGLDPERRALNLWVGALLLCALLLRLIAEAPGAAMFQRLGTSAALWILAWLLWGARALPRLIRVRN